MPSSLAQLAPSHYKPTNFATETSLNNAFEIGLLGDALMRFVRALDAIVPFVALGRKQLRDLIHAARSGLASGAGRVVDGLANLEPVIAQSVPLCCPADPSLRRRDGTG